MRLLQQEDPALTRNWKKTVHIAVTGASGQISNHLLFMLASGAALALQQPSRVLHVASGGVGGAK